MDISKGIEDINKTLIAKGINRIIIEEIIQIKDIGSEIVRTFNPIEAIIINRTIKIGAKINITIKTKEDQITTNIIAIIEEDITNTGDQGTRTDISNSNVFNQILQDIKDRDSLDTKTKIWYSLLKIDNSI